ncbi:hypothetical protein [Gordonia sp. DT101]|uniref:hypothetical protein n=1 Tax=Gordonia sp. DT101 TaxID=3416545 RepID=UPI003CF75DBB
MTSQIEAVLGCFAGYSFADSIGGRIVEDEMTFMRRFKSAINCVANDVKGCDDLDVVELVHNFVDKSTSTQSLEQWIQDLRAVGYSDVWGRDVVDGVAPDYSMLLFRLARDWRSGLSWSADARYCHTGTGVLRTGLKLWCAVVPVDALLARVWHGPGISWGGCPMLRTIEHAGMGRVTVGCDDFAEVLVDPGALADGEVLTVGRVVDLYDFG